RCGCSARRPTPHSWLRPRACRTCSRTGSAVPASTRRWLPTATAFSRASTRRSERLAERKTFLTVNAVAAPTEAEARRRALPRQLSVLALQTSGQLSRELTIEEAEQVTLPAGQRNQLDETRRGWLIGTPADVLRGI